MYYYGKIRIVKGDYRLFLEDIRIKELGSEKINKC